MKQYKTKNQVNPIQVKFKICSRSARTYFFSLNAMGDYKDDSERVNSFVNTYIDSLESEWRVKRNVWLQNSKFNPGNAKLKKSIYAHETFRDYMSSQSAQNIEMQVPFHLPEVPNPTENPNPILKDADSTISEEKTIVKANVNNNPSKGSSDQVEYPTLVYKSKCILNMKRIPLRCDFTKPIRIWRSCTHGLMKLHFHGPRNK